MVHLARNSEERVVDFSDEAIPRYKTWPRPRFHTFTDGRIKDAELCRALLSAVIQGFPPPVLVGYREKDTIPIDLPALWRAVSNTLSSYKSHIGGDDVVLWLGKRSWVQLPADVLIRRYLQQIEASTEVLARSYGDAGVQPRLFFPASKMFDRTSRNDTHAHPPLQSTLLRDTHNFIPDESLVGTKYVRSRSIISDVFMGEAQDIASFLSAGVELVPPHIAEDIADTITTTHLFLNQELQRQQRLAYSKPPFLSRLFHLLSGPTKAHAQMNHTDLGLTPDHEFRLFQPINPTTTDDIQSFTIDRSILADSPSKTHKHLYKNPLGLPPELPGNLSPLAHLSANDNILLAEDLQHLQDEVKWSTVRFATNMAVPRGSIPAVLTLRGTTDEFAGAWWNERGGRGGLWTDLGVWMPWERVCGPEFNTTLFGEDSGAAGGEIEVDAIGEDEDGKTLGKEDE